jgi:hypothetical protein
MILPIAALYAACDEGDVGKDGTLVGGPCAFSDECDEPNGSFCLSDESFPGGTCAKRCVEQETCPDGSACVNKNSGICLLLCTGQADCREGYECTLLANQEGGGQSSVCIAPPNMP